MLVLGENKSRQIKATGVWTLYYATVKFATDKLSILQYSTQTLWKLAVYVK